jgi:type II secretory pathway pseudopilin PulG
MKSHFPIRRIPEPSEEGYILVAVIFMLALLMIAMAVAAPVIKKEIQRDRDLETMERGKQYIRAIKLYYKKFNAYPPNVDALVKTNEIRFLRKKYTDPITGKDDWKPIRFGQNKVPTAMGFFGQPLGGSTLAGTGPSGGNGVAGASTLGSGLNSSTGSSGAFGSSSLGASPTSTTGPSTGSNNTASSGALSATDPNLGGQTGQTFGGAGIIGFSPGSPKQSILVYKKKNHYNEWEFTYDPLAERMMGGGNAGTIGQSATSLSNGIGGAPTPGTGLSPTSATPTPQQTTPSPVQTTPSPQQ